MGNEQSAIALLLFRVGPVLCCAPANPVQTIISPPKLTRPPGTNDAKPGIFFHADHVVSVSDLRHRFGINETEREQPGRLIITLHGEAYIAYWVDEIIEVIDSPTEGWSEQSSHLPQGVFTKTLLLDEKIYMFAEFDRLENLPESGYLSQYINKLADGLSAAEIAAEVIENKPENQREATTTSATNSSPVTENDKPADPGQNKTDATGTDAINAIQTDDKAGAQTNTPQANSQQEIDTAVPPKTESTAPLTETRDEKTVAPEANEQEAQADSATAFSPTTDTNPNLVNNDIDTNSPVVDIPEEIAATVETNPTNTAAEEIDEPITEAPTTPTEKATRLKSGYLDPVPSVVPESEQEPEKPRFPWQKLAAAVILFMTVAGIGIYYSWTSPDKTTTRRAKTTQPVTTQQLDVSRNENPVITRHENTMETDSAPDIETAAAIDANTDTDTNTNTDTDTDTNANTNTNANANANANNQHDNNSLSQDNNEYRAEINPDNKGVTIVLHSPENEPVFKATKPALIEKPAIQKDTAVPTNKSKKKAKPNKQEIIHIVVKGDTLWDIAERYVNNPYKYSSLAKLSKIKNPDRIYPGDRVKILRQANDTK